MKIFLGQIDKIKAEFGFKKDRDFDRALGLKNKLYRWRKGDVKGVTLETLLLIREKFKKTLDWLLFGEEPILALAEFTPESYDARPLAPIEADLLNEAMAMVEEVLKEEKQKLQPEQKARLLTRIYNDCAEDRIKPDSIMVKRYLWILN